MKHYARTLSVIFVAVFALGACENLKLGTLLGAGTGAFVGSQIGSGVGQLAAVGVGTLAGAWVGAKIEEKLNYADRLDAEKTAQAALELNDVGGASRWNNKETGNSGEFKPTKEIKVAEGMRCRAFVQTVKMGDAEEKIVGVARRNPDGSWRIVEKC